MIDKFTWKEDGAWVHGPFSNFYHSPFSAPWWGDFEITGSADEIYDWPTVEHYYQAAKLTLPADVEAVLASDSPGRSKKLGRSLPNRPDWQACSIRAMRDALALKFPHGSELSEVLLETGDELLVEGNTWGDRFFGQVKDDDGVYRGQNWLGALLMLRRAELRAEVVGQQQLRW